MYPIIKSGDLILVHHRDFLGTLIRFFTKGYWNHIGLFKDSQIIIEARYVGVTETSFEDYISRSKLKKLQFSLYRINTSIKNKKLMIKFMENEIGRKYDFLQVINLGLWLLFKINRNIEPIDLRHSWFCSELIAEAAYSINLRFSNNIDPDLIEPNDILHSPLVRKLV